jgi:hypothetical protein
VGLTWEHKLARFHLIQARLYEGELSEAARLAFPLQNELAQLADRCVRTRLLGRVMPILRMAHGEAATCARGLASAEEILPRGGMTVLHADVLVGRTLLDMYTQRPRVGWERLQDAWSQLDGTGIMDDPLLRHDLLVARGNTALNLAMLGVSRTAMLKEATAIADRLTRDPLPWIRPRGVLLACGITAEQGGDPRKELALARDALARGEMWLFAGIAGRALALLDNSVEAREQAETWLQEQGVLDLQTFCAAMAPGLAG